MPAGKPPPLGDPLVRPGEALAGSGGTAPGRASR